MTEPFNTTMRDRLTAALANLPPRFTKNKAALSGRKEGVFVPVLVGRSANGRFKSIRTICTNDGAQGVVGTPCSKCGRKL